MVDPTPHLDIVEKLVHIFGIPLIFGAIVWLVRTYDESKRQLTEIDKNSKAAFDAASVIQGQVTTLQSNHMKHMQEDLEKQTISLSSIDKNISILVDRNPRL